MNKVIIYTTPTCAYCKMAMKYFQEKNVQYEQKDVMTDLKAQQEMIGKSHQYGVPVIDINGELIIGYDRAAINKALGIS